MLYDFLAKIIFGNLSPKFWQVFETDKIPGTKLRKLCVSQNMSRIEDRLYSLILKPLVVISGALYDGGFYFYMVEPDSRLVILELAKNEILEP